jgi:hypothetical protein
MCSAYHSDSLPADDSGSDVGLGPGSEAADGRFGSAPPPPSVADWIDGGRADSHSAAGRPPPNPRRAAGGGLRAAGRRGGDEAASAGRKRGTDGGGCGPAGRGRGGGGGAGGGRRPIQRVDKCVAANRIAYIIVMIYFM